MKNPTSENVSSRRQNSIRTGGMILVVTGILFSNAAGRAGGFAYADFRAPSYLIFQGDATLFQQRVRLVPAERGKAGGLWFQRKLFVKDGFETTFQFQLTARGGFGANGLAFVVQNNETPQLGGRGHNMGFYGIPNALAVKFNPYHYKNKHYVKYDEMGVVVGGVSSNAYRAAAATIGSMTNALYTDGLVHTVKIKYQPGRLDVYLDELTKPLLAVPVNLAESVPLEDGRAWVGLTAATGMDYFNHDLTSWSFNSPDNANSPVSLTELLNHIRAINSNSATLMPDRTNIAYAASPNPTLPHDSTFGHVLPADIGLTHQIEASTDLVHWTTVTNAVLYFRDPESTNYDHRFYRFRQN